MKVRAHKEKDNSVVYVKLFHQDDDSVVIKAQKGIKLTELLTLSEDGVFRHPDVDSDFGFALDKSGRIALNDGLVK